MRQRAIWLGLGGNIAGAWGPPRSTLARAVREIEAAGFIIVSRSRIYRTLPIGGGRQPSYLNAVVGVRGSMAPAELLRFVKSLEGAAGRRSNGRWGARPLDVDILDFGGRRVGQPGTARLAGRLLLPHPEIAGRGFVLVPLAEAGPDWRHPRLGVGAAALLRRRPWLRRGVGAVAPWECDA